MPSLFSILCHSNPRVSHSFPTRRSSDLLLEPVAAPVKALPRQIKADHRFVFAQTRIDAQIRIRSEEHTSELQSRGHLVCRLLLEKKKKRLIHSTIIKLHY